MQDLAALLAVNGYQAAAPWLDVCTSLLWLGV